MKGLQRGFTLIEMVVAVGIVLLISTQVLISFSVLRESSQLKRSAQELSFSIRKAQNMAVAISAVRVGGVIQIPKSASIRLTISTADANGDGIQDNGEYFFFADQDGDGVYDANERIEPNLIFPGNMQITSITGATNGNPGAHVIFYTPEARVALTNYNGTLLAASVMDIKVSAPSGNFILVRVRISGQVIVCPLNASSC
ncbi:MAG: type II secretion system protein [Candidatus Sungbacteria bacterium]|nr:type II secretion system protein [Candidatus Sungbacteria bacterium]